MRIGGGGFPPHRGGGGTTGGKGPSPSLVPFNENGGFLATNFYLMFPLQNITNGLVGIGILNINSFDDPIDQSVYFYRTEDIIPGRVPTVRRVIIVYRDLGPAVLLVSVKVTDDNQAIQTTTVSKAIGTPAATGDIFTVLVDIAATGFQPQLSIARSAGAGPISLISVTMLGEVEEQVL